MTKWLFKMFMKNSKQKKRQISRSNSSIYDIRAAEEDSSENIRDKTLTSFFMCFLHLLLIHLLVCIVFELFSSITADNLWLEFYYVRVEKS